MANPPYVWRTEDNVPPDKMNRIEEKLAGLDASRELPVPTEADLGKTMVVQYDEDDGYVWRAVAPESDAYPGFDVVIDVKTGSTEANDFNPTLLKGDLAKCLDLMGEFKPISIWVMGCFDYDGPTQVPFFVIGTVCDTSMITITVSDRSDHSGEIYWDADGLHTEQPT